MGFPFGVLNHSCWLCFIKDQVQCRTAGRSHGSEFGTEDQGCSTSSGTSFLGDPGPAHSPHWAQFFYTIVRCEPYRTVTFYSSAAGDCA